MQWNAVTFLSFFNSGMKLHAGKEHTGEEYIKRAVSCDICHKSFRCQSDLKIHSVVHSKEKPFSCDMCSAVFSQRASLKGMSTYVRNRRSNKPFIQQGKKESSVGGPLAGIEKSNMHRKSGEGGAATALCFVKAKDRDHQNVDSFHLVDDGVIIFYENIFLPGGSS